MIPIDVTMTFVNLDKFLVKDRFCTNKESTRLRIRAPYNRGSAIDLRRNLTIGEKPIKDRKITSQNGVFWVCLLYTSDAADE